MVYAYYRYSTGKQTEMQQEHRVREYCTSKGIKIDSVVIDRAVSGAISIENRNLAALIGKMKPGDTLIVSEVSRISRSIGDFCEFILVAMPKLKARLIVCSMGLDIDCANMSGMTQMQLMMFSCFAQIERELITDRIQAAIDARKEAAKVNGGWTSKAGNYCTHLGRDSFNDPSAAGKKSAFNKKKKFMKGMRPVAEHIRLLKSTTDLDNFRISIALNKAGFRTGNGGKFHHSHIPKILKYDEEGIYYEDTDFQM